MTRHDDSHAPEEPDQATRVVSIVVVTYNSAATMPQLVRSLPDELVGVGEHELIVVDSASSDGTLDTIARTAPSARHASPWARTGLRGGINAGVRGQHPGGAGPRAQP